MGRRGGAEHVVQTGAQVVPGLRVELAPVGEDEVLEAGDAGPGELLVVLLDAPLEPVRFKLISVPN